MKIIIKGYRIQDREDTFWGKLALEGMHGPQSMLISKRLNILILSLENLSKESKAI